MSGALGSGEREERRLRSFEAVTGPKRERWLVRTVGELVAAIGGTLGTARGEGEP